MVFGKEYWERIFLKKEDPWGYSSCGYERRRYERQTEVIKRYCAEPSNILEIGCAEGVYTLLLAKDFPAAKIVGIDISNTALDRVRGNCRNHSNVSFIEQDVVSLLKRPGFFNGGFDVVVHSGMLPFLMPRLTIENSLTEYFSNLLGLLTERGILVTSNECDAVTWLPMKVCYHLLNHHSRQVYCARYRDWNPFRKKYCSYDVRVFTAAGSCSRTASFRRVERVESTAGIKTSPRNNAGSGPVVESVPASGGLSQPPASPAN